MKFLDDRYVDASDSQTFNILVECTEPNNALKIMTHFRGIQERMDAIAQFSAG